MGNKRKILLLSWEFPPNIIGGLGRHVHGLSKELVILGYEIYLITAGGEGKPSFEDFEGIHVYRVLPLNKQDEDFLSWIGGLNMAIADKAIYLSSKERFELIHAHDWLVSAAAIVLKEYLQIPLITTIHATEYGRNNGIYTELQKFIHHKEKSLVEQSDHIIVCSNYMSEEIKKLFFVNKQNISVIDNGVDVPVLYSNTDDLLKGLPIDSSKKMIFSLGRIVKEKGFDILIDAARKLKEAQPDVYFIIAGNGPLLDYYRRRVRDLSLENVVFFIGFINDKVRDVLFKECFITVFPSRYEPFGIVALEAMIAGKPVIAANVGGLKGIILHMETGLLMERDSPESFIEQVVYLLEHESIAINMGLMGRQRAKELFSWRRVALTTKELYEKFL